MVDSIPVYANHGEGSIMAWQGKRDLGKERQWRRTFRQWRSSGLSVRAYCADYGLTEALFYSWRRVISERDQERAEARTKSVRSAGPQLKLGADGAAPVFVPLRVIDVATPAALEVVLPHDRVVRVPRGFDADTLRQLLATLEEERPC